MTDPVIRIPAATVEAGEARGLPLALAAPLSFWGGYDSAKGVIVEDSHPDRGASLRGRVLLMTRAKGSSSSSSVLAEAIRNGTGPAAIVMLEHDLIIALGAIVAHELYGLVVPIVVVAAEDWPRLVQAGAELTVQAEEGGAATVSWRPAPGGG